MDTKLIAHWLATAAEWVKQNLKYIALGIIAFAVLAAVVSYVLGT